MSLRWKVALAMATISLAATITLGVASYRSTADRLSAELDRSLTVLDEDNFRDEGDGPGGRPDNDLPDRNPLSAFDLQQVDADGVVAQTTLSDPLPVDAATLSVVGEPGRTAFSTVDVADTQYRVLAVGSRDGAMQIARSLGETNRILDGVRNRTVALVVGIAALSALVGWSIAGRVTSSLRRLTAATESIARTGDLDVRVATGGDEVGRLGDGFNKMTAALAQSRAEQQRLVQDAGHELRTPLTSLRTNVDLLRRYPSMGNDDRAAVLRDIFDETAELSTLVDEVVTIASGERDDEPGTDLDLTELADALAVRFSRRTGRPVTVGSLDERPAIAFAQRDGVMRVLSCLVENACKFDTSDAPVEIDVGPGEVRVSDRGPGIEPADRRAVFERFYRADAARSAPGSGLGLAIVSDIVGRNHGSVDVEERAGGGAVFIVRLPVVGTRDPDPAGDR